MTMPRDQCICCGRPLTASANSSIKKIHHFNIEICGGCGFGRTASYQMKKALKERELADRKVHLHYTTKTNRMDHFGKDPSLDSFPRLHSLENIVQPGRLLDIGTGFIGGYRIAKAVSSGWDAYGIEPNPIAAKRAETNAPGRIICGTLEDIKDLDPFDVITLYHVLEHFKDPLLDLKMIFSLLRPNGVLDLAVPNRKSFAAWLCGQHWPAWMPDDHFNHFTTESLRLIVERAGFQVIELHTREGGPELLNALALSYYRRVLSLRSRNKEAGQSYSISGEHIGESPNRKHANKWKQLFSKIGRGLNPIASRLGPLGIGATISLTATRRAP